jgi:hypothetical protein
MKINAVLFSTFVGLGCTSAFGGTVTPVSATRELFVESFAVDSASYSSGYDSDITFSNTLTPFDRKLDKFVKLGKQYASSAARQTSTITPSALNATMTVDEYSLCPSPGMTFSHSKGSINSTYQVDAFMRIKTTVTLKNTLSNRGTATSNFTVKGPTGTLLALSRSAAGQETYVGAAVVQPGLYTFTSVLDCVSQSIPSPTSSQSSAHVTLKCEFFCTADMDMSGFIDIDDFGVFVQAFESGDASADLDTSGFVDTDDFTIFAAEFADAC